MSSLQIEESHSLAGQLHAARINDAVKKTLIP